MIEDVKYPGPAKPLHQWPEQKPQPDGEAKVGSAEAQRVNQTNVVVPVQSVNE